LDLSPLEVCGVNRHDERDQANTSVDIHSETIPVELSGFKATLWIAVRNPHYRESFAMAASAVFFRLAALV
jgi:hypothetical protein